MWHVVMPSFACFANADTQLDIHHLGQIPFLFFLYSFIFLSYLCLPSFVFISYSLTHYLIIFLSSLILFFFLLYVISFYLSFIFHYHFLVMFSLKQASAAVGRGQGGILWVARPFRAMGKCSWCFTFEVSLIVNTN